MGNPLLPGMQNTASIFLRTAQDPPGLHCGMMDRVEILDDHTIRIHLKYAHHPFLLYLTFPIA